MEDTDITRYVLRLDKLHEHYANASLAPLVRLA
jgi:hypothetical protein